MREDIARLFEIDAARVEALLEQVTHPLVVPEAVREPRRPEERAGAQRRGGAVASPQCALQPRSTLAELAAERPEVRQRRHETELEVDVAGLRAPVECGAEVALLLLQLGPRVLRRRTGRFRRLGERRVVPGMTVGDGVRLPALAQALEGVLADRLEHHVAGLAVSAEPLVEQASGDQRREGASGGIADAGGGRGRAPAPEDGQPGFLGDLLGDRSVSDRRFGDSQQARLVPLEQFDEGFLLPGAQPLDERDIVVHAAGH